MLISFFLSSSLLFIFLHIFHLFLLSLHGHLSGKVENENIMENMLIIYLSTLNRPKIISTFFLSCIENTDTKKGDTFFYDTDLAIKLSKLGRFYFDIIHIDCICLAFVNCFINNVIIIVIVYRNS